MTSTKSKSAVRAKQVVPDVEKLTLKSIRDRIPKHYFQQSTLKSSYYMGRDVVQSIATIAAMHFVLQPLVATAKGSLGLYLSPVVAQLTGAVLTFLTWNLFWFVQGLNWTALWVLAHECGHQGFSPSRTINNTVGYIVHTFLLVPYHSWRITHGNHHKHTNHLDLDTVFVPEKKKSAMREAYDESPLATLSGLLTMLVFGWPAYLTTNIAAQKYDRRTNHFEPSSPLFRAGDRADVVISTVGVVGMLALLVAAAYHWSVSAVVCWYVVPYLWTNAWLVYITFLQHTDVRLPHYDATNWNYVRGALCTVDRDYGFVFNWWLHHINDSHVIHHLFSSMPFYNAIEVTRKYVPEILPAKEGIYLTDSRPLWKMLVESWLNCIYVIPSEGIAFFKR